MDRVATTPTKHRCCGCIPIRAGVLALLGWQVLMHIITLFFTTLNVRTYHVDPTWAHDHRLKSWLASIIMASISLCFYLVGFVSALRRHVPTYNAWSTANFVWVLINVVVAIVFFANSHVFNFWSLVVIIFMVYLAYVCWAYRRTLAEETGGLPL
ncbi:hypothetical protein RI367_005023 [Sorochytrium milnesiophthora]